MTTLKVHLRLKTESEFAKGSSLEDLVDKV